MATAPKGVTAARPKAKDNKKGGKDDKPTFPTEFGSHASMVNEEVNGTIVEAKQDAGDPWSILTDERGNYATRKSRLDTGMADPNRFADIDVRDQQVKNLTTA
jgi:hypothetical protein